MSSNKVPVIPLVQPGTFDWHYGDSRDKWITYDYIESDGVRTVNLSGNNVTISNNSGTVVHNNSTGYDYIFFPLDDNPLSLSAVEPNKAFAINLFKITQTNEKWFIRIVDKLNLLKSCNGFPLENGVTVLKSNYLNGQLVQNPPRTFIFSESMTQIPPYTSATINGEDVVITKSRPKPVKGKYVKDKYGPLKSGNNVFNVPKGGEIRLWNLGEQLNKFGEPNYMLTHAAGNTEKLVMYGNINSVKNHSYQMDLPTSGAKRINMMQPGEFHSFCSGFTDLQKLNLIEPLPHSVPPAWEQNKFPRGYCSYMFADCSSLSTGVRFNQNLDDTLSCDAACFSFMFKGCSKLTGWNNVLYAHYTAGAAYMGMFMDCTSIQHSSLNINTTDVLDSKRYCTFDSMFAGCTKLRNPNIDIYINDSIGSYCFANMFAGCTSLDTVPNITLYGSYTFNESCFAGTFKNTKIDEFDLFSFNPIEYDTNCCKSMFEGCTKLNLGEADPRFVPGSTSTGGGPVWVAGIGYPDYAALAVNKKSGSEGDITMTNPGWVRISTKGGSTTGNLTININGINVQLYSFNSKNAGNTWFLPVKKNTTITWDGDSTVTVGHASTLGGSVGYPDYNSLAVGGTGTGYTQGQPISPSNDGWIRVSVLHNANYSDGCVRLYQDCTPNESNPHIGLHKYAVNSPSLTYLFPVKGGHTYYVTVADVTEYYIRYAPCLGSSPIGYPNYDFTNGTSLTQGVNFPVPADGWVKLFVSYGSCIRFMINGDSLTDWNYALPLYGGYKGTDVNNGCGVAYFLPVMAGQVVKFIDSDNASYSCYGVYTPTSVGYGEPADSGHWEEGEGTTIVIPDSWEPGDWDAIPYLRSQNGFKAGACNKMCKGGSSVTYAPVFPSNVSLKSSDSTNGIFSYMFQDCSNLCAIKWDSSSVSINNTTNFQTFANRSAGYLFTANSSDIGSVNTSVLPAGWKRYSN